MEEYKLIADSCCELTDQLRESELHAETVPLSILLGDTNYVDDLTMDVPAFIEHMRRTKKAPVSSCPPPDFYLEKMREAVHSFAVTISSKLSGSYNSALNAAAMLREEDTDGRHKVHVFDSLSASAGEIAISLKIQELVAQRLDFEAIIERTTAFIKDMKTFFILENLDTLIKAGRMSRITGYVATTMSLRPIMTAELGEIKLFEKARGSVRAFTRLVDIIGEKRTNFSEHTLVITHCNNERQAKFIKAEALKRYTFKDIVVQPTRGLSTMYANEGGVIIAF